TTREDFEEFKITAKLPLRKNPNFCGRDNILLKLHQVLQPPNDHDSNSERRTAVLYGIGGIGKSQIALEYAHGYRFSRFYTSIFWIDATDVSRIAESAFQIFEQLVTHYATKWRSSPNYSEIANILGIPGQIDDSGSITRSTPETAMKAIHTWLGRKENQQWLLLIDNKNSAEISDFDTLLPTCNWGSVLITSRLSTLNWVGKCIEVEGIGAKAGLDLMLRISGLNYQTLEEFEIAEANKIVAALGEVPMALDQVAAYIGCQKIIFSAYRKKLQEGPKIKKGIYDSVFKTWELSFQELDEDARQLLHLCAFLSNEEIPEELFRRGKKAVDWIFKGEDRFDNAKGRLFTFSLVKRNNSIDSFWIHPLIHTWARERIDGTAQRQNAEIAITLVAAAIGSDDEKRSSNDSIFERRILNHLNACRAHFAEYFSGSEITIKVIEAISTIGFAFKELGFYKQAEETYQSALAGKEKALGSNHPSTLATVHNMASVFDIQGRYEDALEMYKKVLMEGEKALGRDHHLTLTTLHNMALVFVHQERYEEALEMYQRSLVGKEKTLGSDHAETLTTVHGIASVFDSQGRYKEALKMYQRALLGLEKVLGNDNLETLTTAHKIASIFDRQGRYEEALEMYERARVGYEKTLGGDHPSTLHTMERIASIFEGQERYGEALNKLQMAFAGFEKVLGRDNPSTLHIVERIASVFEAQGQHDEALEMFQTALVGFEKTLGRAHPSTLNTVHSIASVFNIQGRYNEALEMYQLALVGQEKSLGNDHPETLTTLHNIASVFDSQGQSSEALGMFQRALKGREKVLGSDHPETLATIRSIALVFDCEGRYNEALEMFQRVLTGFEAGLGSDHALTLEIVGNMAWIFNSQGRSEEATQLEQRYGLQ
ncbi:hypothetical protein RUND412_007314, partial [Rhizina undulata]